MYNVLSVTFGIVGIILALFFGFSSTGDSDILKEKLTNANNKLMKVQQNFESVQNQLQVAEITRDKFEISLEKSRSEIKEINAKLNKAKEKNHLISKQLRIFQENFEDTNNQLTLAEYQRDVFKQQLDEIISGVDLNTIANQQLQKQNKKLTINTQYLKDQNENLSFELKILYNSIKNLLDSQKNQNGEQFSRLEDNIKRYLYENGHPESEAKTIIYKIGTTQIDPQEETNAPIIRSITIQ